MAFKGRIRLTNAGKALIASAQLGGKLDFLRFVLGDGTPGGDPTGSEIPSNVISPKALVPLSNKSQDGRGQVVLRGSFKNTTIPEPFVWREFGLYATGSTADAQVLFSYGWTADGEPIADGASGLVEKLIRYTSTLRDSENVELVVDGSVVGITMDQLHGAIDGMMFRVAEPVIAVTAGGWVADEDGLFRKSVAVTGMLPTRGLQIEVAETYKWMVDLVDVLRRAGSVVLVSEREYNFPFELRALIFDIFTSPEVEA